MTGATYSAKKGKEEMLSRLGNEAPSSNRYLREGNVVSAKLVRGGKQLTSLNRGEDAYADRLQLGPGRKRKIVCLL